ncbi:MAG: TonB-dependent receptor [Ignavibacteriales bacterium]|nr:TonB-dependent receptor [Ignavibacteriales bacterium]
MKTFLFLTVIIIYLIFTRCDAQVITQEEPDTTYYFSPVVVYPTYATERETPATFSNISQQQISERYSIQDIPALLSELPSVTYYSENGNGIGYNYIKLRGFDQRRISVMINGIPQNDPEDHNVYWIDFPDLMASTGDIQIQRGSGSAFYGPPAIGGSVNLVTNPFNQSPAITFESILGFQEYGDRNYSPVLSTKKFNISINSGLIDGKYLFYTKLGKIQSTGYRDNSWIDLNSYFIGGIRLDKNMTTRFHIFGGPISDGLVYTGLPKFVNNDTKLRLQNLSYWEVDSTGTSYNYYSQRRKQEIENFSQPHYELMNDWKITSELTLANTFFYYTGDGFFDYDASWADTSMLRLGSNYGIPTSQNPTNALVRAFVGNRQGGWLPRLEIDHNNGSLTLGAELRFHRSVHWGKIQFAENLPANIDPDYHFYEYHGEKDILSFCLHELYKPSDDISVMADIQFVRNRYGINNEKFIGNDFSISYFFANPRIGINYNINTDWNSYISLGYTSREPRLRNLYAAEDSYFGAAPQFKSDTTGGFVKYDFKSPLAKPERLLDIEFGFGYNTPITKLSANIFWMEFTDELVKNGQVDIFGQPVTGNAGRSRHVGLEIEGRWQFLHQATLSGNLSYSRNQLIRYIVIENGLSTSLDGNPLAGFPDLLANLRLSYKLDELTSSLTAKYVGPFYTDNFKNEENKNDPYTIFNTEFLYKVSDIFGMELLLRGEVRNIFNRLYFMSGEGNSFFPAAERNYILGISSTF